MKKRKQCCSTNRDGYRCQRRQNHRGSHGLTWLDDWKDVSDFFVFAWLEYGGWR